MLTRPQLARPLRAACSSLSGTPRLPPCYTPSRTYAISIGPQVASQNQPVPRVYSERRTYLFNKYTRIFKSSTHSPCILIQHANFSVPRFIQLRKDIAAAALKHATPAPSLATSSPSTKEPELPTLTVISTQMLGATLREFNTVDPKMVKRLAAMVQGCLAVLTMPNLNPPQLNHILRVLASSVPPPPPVKTPEQLAQQLRASTDNDIPGRRIKRQRAAPIPELKVIGALIEGRLITAEGVKDVAKLPTLDTLRAQLVGLLSAPGAQLAAVLNEASGGRLARTLEGFKKSLEDDGSKPTDAP